MTAKDIIRKVVESSYMLVHLDVDDLADADLMVRSVPKANHIAWQLGHMAAGTRHMLGLLGREAPGLPDGFEAAHSREASACDDPAKFRTKAEYLALMEQMKAATLAAIDATPEGTLGDPAPEAMREYAPTVADALLVLGWHWMMHAGQFVPIRRKLGKGPQF